MSLDPATRFGSGRKGSSSIQESWWSIWKRPFIAVVLAFLCNVENGMLAMGEWPYMSTIDHDATSSFFGCSSAANKAVHVLSTFIFAYWATKTSKVKLQMVVGRCITLVGCIMYVFVEFIPSNRRWWMLACYVLFGVGFGTSPLLRAYIARTTSEENRASGFAMLNAANLMSIMVGSAPIYFAIITNIIAILISVFVLKEQEVVKEEKSLTPLSLSTLKAEFRKIRSLNLPWILIGLVLFEKIVGGLYNATMTVIVGPLFTSMYAFTGEQIVIVVGILAVVFTVSFVKFNVGKYVSCRVLFAASNIMMIAGILITYPYPFMSTPMQPFNALCGIVLIALDTISLPKKPTMTQPEYEKVISECSI